MKQNLINKDISRCVNHRCTLRTDCKRYMQLEIDKHNNIADTVSYTQLYPAIKMQERNKDTKNYCEHQIKIK